MSDGFAKLKAALESTYACLGISCGDVGGLYLGAGTTYYKGAEPCTATSEAIRENADAMTWGKGVGYDPGTDVSQHARLDLDQAELEAFLKKGDFAAAGRIYNQGGNSGGYAQLTLTT